MSSTTTDKAAQVNAVKSAADALARAEDELASAKQRASIASSEETGARNRRNLALRDFEKARLAMLTPDAARELAVMAPSTLQP